jgi:hypothetical protein
MSEQGKRLLSQLLIGAAEIVARAGSRAMESAADDVVKLAEQKKRQIKEWRERELGEIDVKGE